MNKQIISLFLLSICCTQLPAAQNSVEVTQGYRRDTLKSTIKQDSSGIHLERKYKDIDIYQSRIAGAFGYEEWFARINLGYGDVTHGDERIKLNELAPFPLKGHVTSGYTVDTKVEFGKHFAVTDTLSLSPLAGFLWEKESLKAKGNKTQHKIKIPQEFRHHTRDTFKWNAPFVGINGSMNLVKDLTLFAGYKFLFAVREYNRLHWENVGTIHYNSKRSKGYGNMGTLGAGYSLNPNWMIKVEGALSDIHTKGGKIHGKVDNTRHVKTSKTTSEIRLSLDYLF